MRSRSSSGNLVSLRSAVALADSKWLTEALFLTALKYHPDRNPGREAEFNAKFQAIQAAHEILSDPQQRLKYDTDRLRAGYGKLYGPPKTNATRQPNTASYAHPTSTRTQASSKPGFPPRPSSYHAPPSAGAQRYASYARAAPQQPWEKMHDDSQTRADAFRGFQEMKGNSSMPSWASFDPRTGRTTYQSGRTTPNATPAGQSKKSAYEHVNSNHKQTSAPRGQTPFGNVRSQSTKKKNGFDPGNPGGDEPMARNTSAYSSSRAERPFFEPAPSPTAKKKTAAEQEDSPIPGFERLSTRYATTGGEKTYFSSAGLGRSTSVRDTPGSPKPRSRTNPPSPTAPQTGRHHSASPKLKTDHNRGFSSDVTSSDEDDDEDDDEGAPRAKPKATPKSRLRPNQKFSDFHTQNDWNRGTGEHSSAWPNVAGFWTPSHPRSCIDESRPWTYHEYMDYRTDNEDYEGHDSDSAAYPNGSHRTADPATSQQPETQGKSATNGETEGFKTQFNLYGSTPNPCTRKWSEKWGFSSPRTAPNEPRRKLPYWAYPSSVMAPDTSPKRFKVAGKERRAAPKEEEILASIHRVKFSINESADGDPKADSDALNSFEGSPTASASPNGEFKSRSHENLRTTFSASDWQGTFQGAAEFFAPAPSGKDQGTRASRRVSPTRGRTATRQGYGSQSKPTATSQDSARTPFPSQQQPTPFINATFSADSWAEQLKTATFTMPFPDGTQQQANIRRARSPRKQSRPAVKRTTASVSTEAEEAKTTIDGSGDESAKNIPGDGEAMDIDEELPSKTDVPQTNGTTSNTTGSGHTNGPRLVSVEPNRPEWRAGAREDPTTQDSAASSAPKEPSSNSGAKTNGVNSNSNLFNLKKLSNVTPFTATNSVGIEDLNDIHANLPFESRPNQHAARRPVRPRELDCPNPPKRPLRPPLVPAAPGSQQMVLPRKAWERYVTEMNAYMREWNEFNRRMLRHFTARQEAVETGLSPVWISAVGDSTRLNIEGEDGKGDDTDNSDENLVPGKPTGGFSAYLRGVEEDFKVREHWDVAWERHRECILELGDMREWIRNGGKVV